MNDLDISRVYLINTPLENDYKHTLYFTSKDEQYNYFRSKVVDDSETFTYIRKDNVIHYPAHYDDIYNVNYVMYQNPRYNNKWFYAFVKELRYENDECTIIEIETDVIQTWLFDYTIKPSFVEREHVSDDTVGKHTVPETLETGEYIDQIVSSLDIISWYGLLGNTNIVLAVSENGLNITYLAGNKIYNGVYSGLYYITFPTPSDCTKYIDKIQSEITEDIIYSAFVVPSEMVANTEYFTPSGCNFQMGYVKYTETFTELKIDIPITDDKTIANSYKPRNNKLLCYPYRYMLLSNNAGSVKEYRYEDFEHVNNECRFKLIGAISPGCAIKLLPQNYLNVDDVPYSYNNYIEGLDAPKLPTCGWTNDSYTNWLTQNAVNMPLNFIGSGASLIGGIATGNVGAMVGGVAGITSQVASIYEHSLAPVTAKGGVNQGDLLFADRVLFIPYKKSIKQEYAKIIDSYFDMFGYKVNSVKTPNKAHRSKYWYTKTIDINIDGNIPQNDMQIIKNAYNNGITFWRNASEIQNYSVSNGIV